MASTNLNNMVDDATVDALHEVVSGKGAVMARRYYKLKAKLLGMDKLKWSDRNATMPFAIGQRITFLQGATGTTVVTATGGVTLVGRSATVAASTGATLIKIGVDKWFLF